MCIIMCVFMQITFSVPFALASIYCSASGAGQGKTIHNIFKCVLNFLFFIIYQKIFNYLLFQKIK
jgi:uncharacterized membrane protein (DUF373 family)